MTQATSHRIFDPGTTGWTLDDLSDPEIQWHWSEGRYELVEGVLTKMAPQGFEGIDPLSNLRALLERHLDQTRQSGKFYHEVDVLLRADRIPRPLARLRTFVGELTRHAGIRVDPKKVADWLDSM